MLIRLFFLLFFLFSSFHSPSTAFAPPVKLSHSAWDALLKKYVSAQGKVNYAGFKQDKTKLEQYLKYLSDQYSGMGSLSADEQKAYWINAYNAFTVKIVVDYYPVKSIQDIVKKSGNNAKTTWDIAFIKLGSKTFTLNEIEHSILRKNYDEPRFHFALVCAAKSCPKLRNEAYEASKLPAQLEDQTKTFINNGKDNLLTAKSAQISQLFNWYKDDFTKSSGSILTYLNKYAKVKLESGAKISYLEYNWGLNE